MDINQIREQYPQYDDLSDGELAFRMWDRNYKGQLPMGQFADRIKLPQDGFRQMIDFAEQSGYQPTTETGEAAPVGRASGVPRAALQGMTFGFGDEIVGGLAGAAQAAGNVLQGQPANLGQEVGRFTEQERQRIGQFQQEAPVSAAASEIGGAVASGVAAPAVRGLQQLGSVGRAAVTGAGAGALYGAGTGEGGIRERAQNAVEVAIPSALFGAAGQGLINVGTRQGRRVAELFRRSSNNPTIDTLRQAKNAAYQAVDDSGVTFTQDQMRGLLGSARRAADDVNYVPDVDKQTTAAIQMIENNVGRERTVGQLDKLRHGLWDRYNASKGSEPAILDMIDAVDEMIQNHPATNELMTLARSANNRYKKAEMLDMAMERARLQTASTGSGGNILNKYKQAITSILTDPKKNKWFNEEEIASMNRFVEGSLGENVLRQIGKLSPIGNDLMTALNIGAIAANPAMVGVTAIGAGSKAISDRMGQRGMEQLLNQAAGAPLRPQFTPTQIPGLPAGAAAGVSQNRRDQ